MSETATPDRAQILRNLGWHASEKLLRLFTGFFVGLWLARVLGPEDFGRFNYLLAWLGLFNAIAWLGVGDTVVRDLVRERGDEARILGSAFGLRLLGSLLAVALALGVGWASGALRGEMLLLLALLALGVPFAEVPAGIWMWFASHTRIGPVALGKNLSMALGALLRVAVVLLGLGLAGLVAAVAAESVLLCLFILAAYRLAGQRWRDWRWDARHARGMLLTGLPLLLSALAVSLNARVDQLVLGQLAGMDALGQYSAALRFSEIWWVLPPIILQTLAPRFIYAPDLRERLRPNVARILAGMLALALLPCVALSLVGPQLLGAVLGPRYGGAAPVLVLHVWTAVAVFADAPVSQYLLATGRQRALLMKSLLVLALNLAGALWLVPRWGGEGAALALLAAQLLGLLLLPLWPSLRDLGALYREALLLPLRWLRKGRGGRPPVDGGARP